jgi:rhodanese-related sulfurtransferase
LRDIDNEELLRLLAAGSIYLDVRTVEEFSAGHVPGAFNVPLLVRDEQGALVPNPDFLTIATALLEGKSEPIIACQAGGRSRKACALLGQTGRSDLLNYAGGFGGGRDPFGAKIPGYVATSAPVSTQPEPGHTYAELKERLLGSSGTP